MTWKTVKIIAIISMTIDHAASILLTQPRLMEWFGLSMGASFHLLQLMSAFGRMAFPIFAFGIAQGCAYTRNRKRFLLRLLLFAVLAEAPFQLALWPGQARLGLWPPSIYNVLFTLLMGALSCLMWDFFRKKKLAWAAVFPIAALVLAAEACHSDYGGLGVLCVLAPYLFREKRGKLGAMAGMVLILYLVQPLLFRSSFSLLNLAFALGAVGILALYNGQKGRQGPIGQYFFYAYYPLHLLIFYGLHQWFGPV